MSVELLAPVGSEEALYAAVRSGTDAVYMGYGRFNARAGAQNFDDDAFAAAVAYCHVRGVKVYLTLNTLVSDGEMSAALDTARLACEAGIDGIIVQDMGLASALRHCCPDMPLHASTQMSVCSPSALPQLKRLGFTRVVLAREMSRNEIAAVCTQAHDLGMEIEVFVHGALCMCVSGQCYMSAVIGRRSGNRGQCAQPCRLPCSDGAYPLSLKDLSLINYVEDMKNIGVDSLKIEGRMKRPEYIAAAVSSFRSMIDSGFADPQLLQRLDSVFSRSGHTDGYYAGTLGGEMFGHRTDGDAAASAAVLGSLRELYRGENGRVPVSIKFEARAGLPMHMSMSAGENTVCADSDVPQAAINRAADEQYLREKCEKFGSTPYYCDKFSCIIDGGLMIPASAVNAMRRECVEKLNSARLPQSVAFYEMPAVADAAERHGAPELFARFAKIEQVPDDLSGLQRIYVPAFSSEEGLRSLVERADGAEIGVELPRALFATEQACENRLETASRLGVKWVLCHSIAAMELARRRGMQIHADFSMNVFNSASAAVLHEMGAEYITLSFEQKLSALRRVTGHNLGILVYGRLPLMLTRNCPASGKKGDCARCSHSRTIIDRAGERFPIECGAGLSEVLNSKTLWMADRADEYAGMRFVMLRFTDEDRERARYVVSAFAGGDKPHGDFTRGLYDRGVI